VAVGHDHNSDYYGNYNGIMLSYGRKSGYGSYGPKFLLRGARVFEISQDDFTITIDTWIR